MKLFLCKLAIPLTCLLVIFCHSCATEQAPISKTTEPKAVKEQIKPPAEPSDIVAKIGDYAITRGQLEKKLMGELRPGPEDGGQVEPIDAKKVLMEMIAEKAMIMDGRRQNLLEDETAQELIKEFRDKQIINLMFKNYLEGKISVTDSEIEEKLKADSRLDRERARRVLERAQANKLAEQYYNQLCEKFHLQKLSNNFSKAAKIHQRLLYQPKETRKQRWIIRTQVKDDLTPEEQNLPLATYDNGKITLKDWFEGLFKIAPPSRPKDLNTPQGVEKFLDRIMRMPLFVAEAESLELDKDENIIRSIRNREDRWLLGQVKSKKFKEIKEPTEEEVLVFFEENKHSFGPSDKLKIDQIWCQDLETAQKAKAALDAPDADFESVKQQYSLEKESKPLTVYPASEAMFWKDLWNCDPNEITGPVKGFYQNGIEWRIVKIMEKTPGQLKEYSSDMDSRIKGRMFSQRRKELLEKYGKELLEKYPYEIYADRIEDIDPLDIP